MLNLDCFQTRVITPKVVWVDEVDSTNRLARDLLEEGSPEGTIVIAGKQSAGRGRAGRKWLSPEGGLYFTVILNPRLSNEKTPLLGLLSACAVASGLRELGVSKAAVKWPNDVLVEGMKISGILSESVTIGVEALAVLVGIGVNQNLSGADLPTYLEWPVTSVFDQLGHETSLGELLCGIVNAIDRLLLQVESSSSFDVVLDEWRSLSCTLGERVRAEEGGEVFEGLATDLASDGALLVETSDGTRRVVAGDLAHLRHQ